MTRLQLWILTALGAVSIALFAALVVTASGNESRAAKVNAQNSEIARGNQAVAVGRNLLTDMVQLAQQSPAIVGLLRRAGLTVQMPQPPAPQAPAARSAEPAAPVATPASGVRTEREPAAAPRTPAPSTNRNGSRR
jgi:hypothetical protein